MGYGDGQIRELEQTINNARADLVLIGTPIDLARLMDLNKPVQRVRYELQETGHPTLAEILEARLGRKA
jgi:predicted GTPase